MSKKMTKMMNYKENTSKKMRMMSCFHMSKKMKMMSCKENMMGTTMKKKTKTRRSNCSQYNRIPGHKDRQSHWKSPASRPVPEQAAPSRP